MKDYDSRDWELPCVCGDRLELHSSYGCKETHIALTEDGHKALYKCSCKQFKLDNLAYVEQVARAKGLV